MFNFNKFFECFVNKNECNQAGKRLLRKSGDVSNKWAEVKGHDNKKYQCSPKPYPNTKGQEIPVMFSVTNRSYLFQVTMCMYTGADLEGAQNPSPCITQISFNYIINLPKVCLGTPPPPLENCITVGFPPWKTLWILAWTGFPFSGKHLLE